jgi:hypothetical protein
MTRDAFADRLLDLAYGELSSREASEVEAHAASCDACRGELARIRETRRLMAALPQEAPADGGERILLAAARQAAEARARVRPRWGRASGGATEAPRGARVPWLWGAAAAAFSLLAVAAVSWRITAVSPGVLERPDSEVLLGGPYAAPPPAPDATPRDAEATRRPAPDPEPHPAPELAPSRGRGLREPAGVPARRRSRAEEAERFAAVPDEASDAGPFAAPPPAAGAAAEPAEAHRGSTDVAPGGDEPSAAAPQAKRAAPEAAPAPVASSAPPAALRAGGMPRAEIRTFEGCEGETLRRVERDAEGRLVRYVREGRIAGRRLRVEHVYGPDGALARATVRDLDAATLLDAGALGLELPARAEEAGLDAPPRCRR